MALFPIIYYTLGILKYWHAFLNKITLPNSPRKCSFCLQNSTKELLRKRSLKEWFWINLLTFTYALPTHHHYHRMNSISDPGMESHVRGNPLPWEGNRRHWTWAQAWAWSQRDVGQIPALYLLIGPPLLWQGKEYNNFYKRKSLALIICTTLYF